VAVSPFTIALEGLRATEQADTVAAKVIAAISEPVATRAGRGRFHRALE